MSGATSLKFASRSRPGNCRQRFGQSPQSGILTARPSLVTMHPSPHRPIDTETVYYSTTRESPPMQKPLHLQTTVLPGGKIVIVDQDLAEGETVEIFVTASSPTPRRSAVDILAESPGHRLFKTPQDVTDYLESERASWEH